MFGEVKKKSNLGLRLSPFVRTTLMGKMPRNSTILASSYFTNESVVAHSIYIYPVSEATGKWWRPLASVWCVPRSTRASNGRTHWCWRHHVTDELPVGSLMPVNTRAHLLLRPTRVLTCSNLLAGYEVNTSFLRTVTSRTVTTVVLRVCLMMI